MEGRARGVSPGYSNPTLFQPQVNRRTSPRRSLSATKREISHVEIEVEILKYGIMSKGFRLLSRSGTKGGTNLIEYPLSSNSFVVKS